MKHTQSYTPGLETALQVPGAVRLGLRPCLSSCRAGPHPRPTQSLVSHAPGASFGGRRFNIIHHDTDLRADGTDVAAATGGELRAAGMTVQTGAGPLVHGPDLVEFTGRMLAWSGSRPDQASRQ